MFWQHELEYQKWHIHWNTQSHPPEEQVNHDFLQTLLSTQNPAHIHPCISLPPKSPWTRKRFCKIRLNVALLIESTVHIHHKFRWTIIQMIQSEADNLFYGHRKSLPFLSDYFSPNLQTHWTHLFQLNQETHQCNLCI